MRKRLPPTLRFAAIPLAIMMLLIAGFYLAVSWRVSEVLLERTSVRGESRSLVLAQRMEVAIDNRARQIELLAAALRYNTTLEAQQLRTLFEGLKKRNPEYVWLGFISPDGIVSASTRQVLEGQSVASRPVFANALQRTFVGDIHPVVALSPHMEQLGSKDTEVMDLGVPVFDTQGQLRGVIAVHISAKWVVSLGHRTVTEVEGSELGLRWAFVAGNNAVFPAPLPFNLPQNSPETNYPNLQGHDGRHYSVQTRRVALSAHLTPVQWTVVIYHDLGIAAAPGVEIQRVLVITAVLGLLLVGGVGYVATKQVTRPFERLFEAAENRFAQTPSAHAIPFGEFIDQLSDELQVHSIEGPLDPEEVFIRRLAGDAQQFKRVIDHFPAGICVSDAAFQIQYVNPSFIHVLGWTLEQLRGVRMPEFLVADEERESFVAQRAAMSMPPGELTWRLKARTAQGSQLAVQCHMIPLLSKGEEFVGTMMLVQDISAELEHRTLAQSASERLSIFAEAVTDYAFILLDAQGRFVEWSPGATALTGWQREAALGQSLKLLLPDSDDGTTVCSLYIAAKQSGSITMDRPLLRSDGSVFLAGGALYYLNAGSGDDKFALILSDETQAKSEADAMAQSEARLNAVIASASDAVISTDIHGTVQLFNPAAERIFKVSAQDMLGSPLDRLLPRGAASAHREHLQGFACSNTTQRSMGSGKVEGLRADGQRLELEASISRAQIGDQVILTAILRDVTERSRVERALVSNQTQLAALAQNLLTQERETTQRLAQALHDDLGQTLAAQRLIYDAGSKKGAQEGALPAWVLRLDRLIEDANRQVRRVLAELRPPLLDELGLYAALDNELRTRKATHDGISFDLHWTGMPESYRSPSEVEYVFFTITREAVGNSIRHANPSTIRVTLKCLANALLLQVVDDGTGHDDLQNIISAGHLGLVGMRERALAIGAKLTFISSVASGTTVQLQWGNIA